MTDESYVELFRTGKYGLFSVAGTKNNFVITSADKHSTPEDGSIRIRRNEFTVQCNKHKETKCEASKYENGVGFYCTYKRGRTQCKCKGFVDMEALLRYSEVILN